MTRAKILILALVLVPLAVVGAVTHNVRSEVKHTVDQAVAALAPLAEISYGGVSVDFVGDIRIHGINIRPRDINDAIHVETIRIETPGLWYLLTGTDELREDGRLPEQARIELHGVELGLGGPIAETLDHVIAASAQAGGATALSNCGEVQHLDMKTYRRLGYASFTFDIAMGYRFEPRRGPLHVRLEWRTRELGAAGADLEFIEAAPRVNDLLTGEARLRAFTIRYRDLSFFDRLARFCAQATGVTTAQYIESEMNRSDAAWQAQWGFVPGPGLRQAYREFLVKPDELQLQGSPTPEIELRALQAFKPDDVAALLKLRVSINGKPVTDLSMTMAPVIARATAPPGDSAKPTAAAAPAAAAASDYRVVPTRELNRYVGRAVRLSLSRGVVREGHLLEIRGNLARIERRYKGGSTTLVIPLNEIERAEVPAR